MKRLCLFAGYSEALVIDDYVLFYIKELSKHSDVYYYSASDISEAELQKLDPFVKRRYAARHDKYDFGSWQKLIYNIGWSNIESYEALILANDSNYGPVCDLSIMFEKMDSSGFDFWGVTANNGVHVHIQSYFINLYKNAFSMPEFRNFFESIQAQSSKVEICIAYEIGLTKLLFKSGLSFGTYIDRAALNIPFGADASAYQNSLLSAGSPFLKKKVFTERGFAREDLVETYDILKRNAYPSDFIQHKIAVEDLDSREQLYYSTNNFDDISDNSLKVRSITNIRTNLISVIKKLIMPIYRPFKYRIVDKLYMIETKLNSTSQSTDQIIILMDKILDRIDSSTSVLQNDLHTTNDTFHTRLHEQQASISKIIDRISDLKKRAADAQVSMTELHGHIDWAQRDILIALKDRIDFSKSQGFSCSTDHPVAYDSPDHLHPVGTLVDHTRHPRFIRACEDYFTDKQTLSFLDLGCSAGGIVWDAILRGHIGIGLEGSDISRLQQRAEWRLLRESLFTCDITKPFSLKRGSEEPHKFDVISAWEVLEHLTPEGVDGMFQNLRDHTYPGSIFACSISQVDGGFTDDGTPLHQTLEPLPWWRDSAAKHGFSPLDNGAFSKLDYARGNGNASIYYRPQHSYRERPGDCLLVVFQRT
ncbi:rhamnan synthesis F family protein [Bosea sp. ASV33]|uniref:rhamnan synthesis F family protein n=1 Tax=Bosea sp. ASV33 TaxID=2795106 RepID=UPI0018ED9128|nr:rhamnan synthesis F family protein [Bosea sp. ASV33]